MASPRLHIAIRSLSLLATGVLAGLALSLAVVQPRSEAASRAGSPRGASESALERLEQEQMVLSAGVARRRATLSQATSSPNLMLAQLERELLEQRTLAGLTPLTGPGLSITLDDGDRPVQQGEEPERLLVHDYDLRDLINALWAAGAEAISVNGERVSFSTYVYCVGSTIVVGDRRLGPPLTILAIGDPTRLAWLLESDPELAPLRERAADRALRLTHQAREDLLCPAYSGPMALHYTRVGD